MPRDKSDPVPPTDVCGISVLLTLDDVSQIVRLSPATIRSQVQRGVFRPLPCLKYPYRWKKSDIEEYIKNQTHDSRYQKHGFATRELRPVKAAIPRRPKKRSA